MDNSKKAFIPINIIRDFRRRWEDCINADEKGVLRDEFFDLGFGDDISEKGWDKVVLGEKYQPIYPKELLDKNGKLSRKEIIRLRKFGYNSHDIAQIMKTSQTTILKILTELGMNKKRKGERDRTFYEA